MTGWNLPPGCSARDIPGNYEPYIAPESEHACELLDALTEGASSEVIDATQKAVLKIIDDLAYERDHLRWLLESAVSYLPQRGPEPPCTCHIPVDMSNDPYGYCARHETGWDEPTLREEIETALKEAK